jgi:peroxiredoxin
MTVAIKTLCAGISLLVFSAATLAQTTAPTNRLQLPTLKPLSAGTNPAVAQARKARADQQQKLIGTQAPDFKPAQSIGAFKSLKDLKGKVVMLDFFAHWCGPCIASLPSVRGLSDDFKAKGLEVIGVTRFYGYYQAENRAQKDMPPETELARMKNFVQEKNLNWPVAFVDKPVFEAYACSAIPHVVVIDRQGKIRKIKVGYSPKEAESFRHEIEQLLAE